MKRQANPNQFHLDLAPAAEPAIPKEEWTLVVRHLGYPPIRVPRYVLKDSQGRMGTERWPGLVRARASLLRSVNGWHEGTNADGNPRTEQESRNRAGWLQFDIFNMGGLAAAW